MAPQIFARQIDAGAWALTAATPSHVRVYRRFGIGRILLANEVVEPSFVRWLAAEQKRDPGFELICLVDSPNGAHRLSDELGRAGAPRPIGVLLEVGYEGGRGGIRDLDAATAVAARTSGSRYLDLLGVEAFEGMIDGGSLSRTLARVDDQMDAVRHVFDRLVVAGNLPDDPILSAGGSAYFDRVVAKLGGLPARLVLRSGCYVTQDGGLYDGLSPLAGRSDGDAVLGNALELWSAVLSKPEPDLVIAGFGKRDAPYDAGLPSPRHSRGADGRLTDLAGAEVLALNDQHAIIRLPADVEVEIGDLLCAAVSHPCGAFDRWRMIPLLDDDNRVVDAIVTFF